MFQDISDRIIKNLNTGYLKSLGLGATLPFGITYCGRKGIEMMEEAYDNDIARGIDISTWNSEYFQKGFLYFATASYSIFEVFKELEYDIAHILNGDIQPVTVATITAVVLGNIVFNVLNKEDKLYPSKATED